ncbi:immunoglobulin superfamily member 10 isoform X1 [Arvicanthis niloticus]|uniref:immunoglobulin superfamily member 10 n=2 Tax=Arvicanthis niloticus TaxID=61156 RepID=UPI001487281E|nr:immunoglobulin superfamily member 10 [Arvicanthis niloticus]XP_034356349.1 immunoglobulin superfamily member 10 [Arvicanthis niloticus]XP_034356350.1 immunoglobulin superfamily member 10 [Arvicanthis niloticus]
MQMRGREVSCLLSSLTVICLVVTPGSKACPRRCACYVPTEVHCTFRYLTSIPDGIPANVERINLGYNSLTRLTENDFSGLSKLELLMLHSNGIHRINDKTFSGLQSLQVLKMSYNKVQVIQKDTFYGLRSLTRLHMDHNDIEFINPAAFYGLTLLRLVHLEGNRLTKLHPDTFVSLSYLQIFKTSFIKYLYLSDNFLTSLPKEMLSYMLNLESLYLHGNPWTCDCHLKWLSEWIQGNSGIIKCKKDRSPSSPQQCPLCMNPRVSKGSPIAVVPAGAFLCTKPTIDPSLKSKSLALQEDNGSAAISPQDFIKPFGSLSLNMTDLSGNKANVVCSIQKPSRTLPIAFTEENDHIMLNMSFSTNLMCNVDYIHIQPVWQLLALYSDSPLILERKPQQTEIPLLSSKYKQMALRPEDIFTNIEADFRADPFWFQQEKIYLQLNRNTTTLNTLQLQFSTDAQITLPKAEMRLVKLKWTMILMMNNTKLEHTVLAGGTIALDCPGKGDPSPHLEWLLADGSKVRAPYVSEDGRILVDKNGKLELQMADSFDTGLYHCISTNDEDADILTYRITVVEPYVESKHGNGVQHTVVTGETIDLPCPSTGIPDASISWILPGNTVFSQSSRDRQILNNGTLRMLQVTPKDQGHYRCVAANPSGADFSIFQVSVQMKGQRTVEHERELDGSGLGEPNSTVFLKQPPSLKLPASALTGTEAGKQVSGIRKKNKHRDLLHRRRGDSTLRRFREHRRQRPLSARRIDPQHWAALLEKAKKNSVPRKQENATVRPVPLVVPPVELSGEERDASGMIPPDEEFMVLKTKASGVSERSPTADSRPVNHGFVTSIASGTEISSTVNPQTLQSEHLPDFKLFNVIDSTAVSKRMNPPVTSKVEDTTNQNPIIIFPSVTEIQDSAEVGRTSPQSTHPVAGGTVATYGYTNILSSFTSKANTALQSTNPTESYGPQIPITGASRASSSDTFSHGTKDPSFSKHPSYTHTTAPSLFRIPRNNNTGNFPLSRHSGRERTIWSRGRVISPHRTPVLRRHRHRTAFKGPANRNMSHVSATEYPRMCRTCSSTERLTVATTALSVPGSSLPKANNVGVIAEESTTVFKKLSLQFKDKQNVDIETITTTTKYFRGESTHLIPTEASMTSTPTSVSLEKTLIDNSGPLSMPRIMQAGKDSVVTPPLSSHLSKSSTPTKATSTKFSKRKVPWHQTFVNNHNKEGMSKNLYQFGSQKNTATKLPKIAPLLPTDHGSPSHSTTLLASLMPAPPATMAAIQHNGTEIQGTRSLSTGKEQPFTNSSPVLPSTISKKSNTFFLSVEIPTVTTPAAIASVIISETQQARAEEAKDQIKGPQKNRKNSNTTPRQISGYSTYSAPTTADTPLAFSHSSLQDAGKVVSTVAYHSATSLLGITELSQECTQTLGNTTASETTLLSKSQETTTTRRASAIPLLLSSGPPPVPTPSPPAFTKGVVTDSEVTSVLKMTSNRMVPIYESSRHNTDLQRPSAEASPNPEIITRTPDIPSSNLLPSTPMPAPRVDKPQNSKWKPSPWPENKLQLKSHSETIEKGKRPAISMSPHLSFPEASTHASQWNAQEHAGKNAGDKKPAQNPTSKHLPYNSLPKTTLKKPRILGGKAASFTVPTNSDAFLPCEAVGDPLPTIHWTKVSSGLEISQGTQKSRFHVYPNGTLSIRRVSIQDRGQYLCSASNPLGTDHLHVTLSVVSYPTRILERHVKEITVHSGSTVELKCRVEGMPRPTISWILANQTVVSETPKGSRKIRVTPDGTLIIHNLSVYDRGFYKCVASNPSGQDSLLVKIQVITAPPVIIEQKRQAIIGVLGESLKLPCTAKGTPQPSVHWVLYDGTELKPLQLTRSKFFLYPDGTLHIRNINPSVRGTYECIATSSSGSERRVVILTVEERETVPKIETASQKWTEVNLGEKLLLNCSATGDPKPTIIWRLPSKAVIDQWHRMGNRIHVYPNGSLVIGSVTEKDGGDYLCVARNKMGDDLVLMHVRLRLTPAKIEHKQHFKKQVLYGKDFQVDCKASGSPVPEVSWSLPDGTVVNSVAQADDSGHRTKRYTLFHNGTLYFNKVGIAEEGDYICSAQNTLGKDEMKVHLTVLTATPRIRQSLKNNMRIKAGDTAVLDCEVTGEPKPNVFWLLPSNNVISFSNDRYTFHANGTLSIHKVKPLDSGQYVCVAQNPSGDDTKTYKLDIVSKPPLINGLYSNKTVIKATAIQHSKKHFDCRADGIPSPQITWIMPDNIFVKAPYYGSRITVHQNGTLEIRNIRLSDSADFTCVVRNEGGESVLVVQLEVLEMLRRPTFRNPFNEKVVAQAGKSVALNCSVDGNPPPEIIWILPDGTQFANRPRNSPYVMASNGSLILYKATRSKSGKYRCTARNKVGYIEKLFLLEIGQKPVILTYELGVVKSVSGESLSLHCVSDGIPKPNVKWTTPGGHVIDRPQVNGKYILHENGTLVIKETTAHDRGNYICKAENSVGHAVISVPVMIVAYPPRIINYPPRSMLRRTGEAMQLHCVALGVPKPKITWETPGHSLLSMATARKPHRSEMLSPQGTLVIQNLQTSDSGVYQCRAQNLLGTDYATTYIQVL